MCSADEQGTRRSLGEVVGGVHGGKYQFGLRGDAGYTGDAFASALASSSSADATRDAADDEPWPRWAMELRRPRGGSVAEAPENEMTPLRLVDGSATVRVTNAYRTWERFYASVLPRSASFAIEPCSGPLAPRGGANNVCDAAKPYSDHVDIRVRKVGDSPISDSEEEAVLLVRTEEDQWLWRLE